MPEARKPFRLSYDKAKVAELIAAAARKARRGGALAVVLEGGVAEDRALVAKRLTAGRGLALERVDLARWTADGMVETEKNLRALFGRSQTADAVLLFDEADALFGRRSEVKSVHNRYARTAGALARGAAGYRGLVILTTELPTRSLPSLERVADVVIAFDGRPPRLDRPGLPIPRPIPRPGPEPVLAPERPFTNLHFYVLVGDLEIGFCQTEGLTSEHEVHEVREADDTTREAIKVAGALHYHNLVLKRGVTRSKDLYYWRQNIIAGKADKRRVEIWQLPAPKAKPVNRWRFSGCWPCRWSGPRFDALEGGVAMEEIELCHQGFQWL